MTGFLKIIRDQTEIRLQAERLEEAQRAATAAASALLGETESLRALFEDAPGFIVILRGPDFVIELANASYRRLIGQSDVVGKTIRAVLPEVEGQGYFELLETVVATGKPVRAT